MVYTEKMNDYLMDKYWAHAADDHFVDCIIYNQETGEELDLPIFITINRKTRFNT